MGRLADVVTTVFSTLNVAAGFLIVVGWFSGSPLLGIVAVGIGVGVPAVLIMFAVKRGVITDRFITDKSKRWPFSIVMAVSLVLAGVIVYVFGASPVMVWALAVVFACVVLVGVANVFWKISAHSTIIGLAAGVISLAVPWYGLLAWGVALTVGWSRVYLKAHTVLQVAAGLCAGVLIASTYLLLM